jgi:crotonobetainyl-CoA:carnitine CoA-transferase CaiB-like acyl-CoA transferase
LNSHSISEDDVLKLPPSAGVAPKLLAGVRVLDLTTSIAAPYATMLLADYGAEVIKVERPGTGDDARAWGPPFLEGESLWFLSVNRNKKSLALDFTTEEGLKILHGIAATCDVVVVNMLPRVQQKLGVDHETLHKIRPDLVFISITGFGLEGPRAGMTCYDLIAEGYSGIMDITGEADSPPQKIGAPAADLLAGMDAVIATISALFDRARTGKGHVIDVSLVESMTRFLTPRIVTYLGSGEVPKRTGAKDSVIAIYQAFETADLPITLGLGNDAMWKRFWVTVGEPAVGEDPRFASNADRHRQRAEIVERIATVLAKNTRSHWLALFAKNKIPAGPINRVDEVSADPELIARGLFYTMDRDGLAIPQVGLGVGIDGDRPGPRTPPPRLGEHSADILRELCRMDEAAIARLREQGVVGS